MADILSQEEIEQLLEVVDDDEEENSCAPLNSSRNISLYDFKRPNRIRKEQLRSFRGIHDMMTRKLSVMLSSKLKTISEVQLHSVDQMTYGEFLMSLPSPTSFNVFSMEPLNGDFILEVNPSIVYPIIDRLLGGDGEEYNTSREFLDVEKKVFGYIVEDILVALGSSWKPLIDTKPKLQRTESSPNVFQPVAQNEIVVMVVMEVVLGHTSGMLNLCFPVINLESLLEDMNHREFMINSREKQLIKENNPQQLKKILNYSEMDLNVNIDEKNMTLEELMNMKKGDRIKINKPNELFVEDTNQKRFIGQETEDGIFEIYKKYYSSEELLYEALKKDEKGDQK